MTDTYRHTDGKLYDHPQVGLVESADVGSEHLIGTGVSELSPISDAIGEARRSEKAQASLEFPDVIARVTRWFGTKRVDWCYGENSAAWNDPFCHWIEINLGDRVLRQSMHGYSSPASFEDEGAFYTAFTAYYEGCLPIEQPLQLNVGRSD